MSAPKENPGYIYKILDLAPSTPLPTTFPPLSELDKKDGFIHLSKARQVPLTASRFFTSHATLYLLKVRFANNPNLTQHTKWESPSSPKNENEEVNFFPHLYGSFGAADVQDVRKFERGAGDGKEEGCWLDVFGKGENAVWLE